MTNKNKNISKLVKARDVDPTSQFEITPTLTEPVSGLICGLESAEDTCDLGNQQTDLAGKSRAELHELIEARSRNLEELRFQLEKALSHRRGLEKELQVREEITISINQEIRVARGQLSEAANRLETLNNEYLALQKTFTNTDVLAKEMSDKATRFRSEADSKGHKISELERLLRVSRSELADLRLYIDGRRDNWNRHEKDLAELNQQLHSGRVDTRKLEKELGNRHDQLVEIRHQFEKAKVELSQKTADLSRLGEENRELKRRPHEDADREMRICRDRIAVQSGELAARAQEIDSLRKDNARFEKYANSLRSGLQDQIIAANESSAMRKKLEASLAVASEMINDLSGQLGQAKSQNQALEAATASLQKTFDREIRQIRFELTNAHDTIADQETINQKLASDLLENKDFRRALESHVEEVEQKSQEAIRELTNELNTAKEDSKEYERKLRIKDNAIADLMKEIASRSSEMKMSDNIENVLQKIDGFRPEEERVRRKGERDHRIARLLIGSADGQDLRFPLFKERLTIGRTPHNDIQLDMLFVSRRHAVIATDNNKTRIIDWGSRNGVHVNNKRVTEKILTAGDVITIGVTNLRYEERLTR